MHGGNEGRDAEWPLNSLENLRVYRRVSKGLGRVNAPILERIWAFAVRNYCVALRHQLTLGRGNPERILLNS